MQWMRAGRENFEFPDQRSCYSRGMNESASATAKSTGPEQKPSPRALLQLAPYLLRYKPRIAGALLAVTVAAAATLAVPLAIRRMIDFGFSAESVGVINTYFLGLIAVA